MAWIMLVVDINIISFIIMEAVLFFNALLGLILSLFLLGFMFYHLHVATCSILPDRFWVWPRVSFPTRISQPSPGRVRVGSKKCGLGMTLYLQL